MKSSLLKRTGVVSAIAAGILFAVAGPASAHVTVNPNTAAKGAYTKVTFRVPNETDKLDTTKVQVNLPTDTPVASVALKPVPGWVAVSVKSKLATPLKTDDGDITEAVTQITWTADATAPIKPGQFQEFDVSLGPLPDAKQIIFKALQTYSDGSIVRWIDEPTTGGGEPEHPAPVLKLTAATADGMHGASASAIVPAAESTSDKKGDGNGAGLSIAGLVVALAALVLGLLAYRKASPARA